MVAQAAAQRVELLVFPEAFLGGYPKGLDFGAPVGTRQPYGREDFLRYYGAAVDLDGPELAEVGELAAQHKMAIVLGIIERAGGTLYCSAVFFDVDGTQAGIHRKTMPTAAERLIWGFGDGSTLGVHELAGVRAGANICWENYLPQARMALYQQGVELYCAPTVDDREIWAGSMRHIAYEGRCFVISACQYLLRSDCTGDYKCWQGDDPETVLIGGGSVIASPLGEILAGPARNGEQLLVADIDLNDITRGKYDLDVVGHYARPDIFTLHVNTAKQQAVRLE